MRLVVQAATVTAAAFAAACPALLHAAAVSAASGSIAGRKGSQRQARRRQAARDRGPAQAARDFATIFGPWQGHEILHRDSYRAIRGELRRRA